MRDIDPHWQSSEPTVIGAASSAKIPGKVPRRPASRRPAALVGILLVAMLGIAAYVQMTPLLGEVQGVTGNESSSVPTDAVTVDITDAGVVPRKVTLRAGQTLYWTNKTTLPHIFESEELKDQNGQSLYSPAIFPGSTQSFTVSESQLPGDYTYASVTANDVSGEIEVIALALESKPTSSSGLNDNQLFGGGSFSSFAPSSSAAIPKPVTSDDPLLAGFNLSVQEPTDPYAEKPVDNPLIPVNPYTIGSTKSYGYVPPVADTTNTLHTGAPSTSIPRPKTQPASGSNSWMIALIISTILITGYLLMPRKKAQ